LGLVIAGLVPIGIWFCKRWRDKRNFNKIELKVYYEQLASESTDYQAFVRKSITFDRKEQQNKVIKSVFNGTVLLLLTILSAISVYESISS